MAIKQNALSYLPKVSISVASGDTFAPDSIKGLFNTIAELQQKEVPTGTYEDVVAAADNPFTQSLWDIDVSKGKFASGTVTFASAQAGDTVTVNGLLYTGVSGAKSDNTEFSIDTGDTETATDLADSINNDDREGTLNDLTATSALGVVTISQSVEGAAGNATTLESSNGTRAAVSGAVFTGGEDESTFDATFVSEEVYRNAGSYSKQALSTGRAVDISVVDNGNTHTVRSILAALKFVQGLENKKDVNGNATATVTTDTAIADDVVTINGLAYTGVSGAKSDNTEFSIDTGDNEAAADLADSINNDVREGTAGVVTASADAAVVTLTSSLKGEAGNATTLVTSDGATLIISGATFSGAGGDGTYSEVSVKGFTPFDSYEWTISKAANVYVLTPTANS